MPTLRDIVCCIALNRTAAGGAPEWIELLPAVNEVAGRDGRTWTMRDPHRVVADTLRNAGSVPLHIDYEHGSEHRAKQGQEAPAAGWIADLEVRPAENGAGAIWARVEWTARAAQMIAEREYRFLSPVFLYDQNTKEVLYLVSAGLTNQPNLTLTALNRRGSESPAVPASPQPKKDNSRMTPESAKALCRKLGLQPEASDDAILSAVDTLIADKATALNQAQTPDLKSFVPRADFDAAVAKASTAETALNQLQTERRETEYVALVDGAVAAGKIAPASKDFYLAMCRKGGVDEVKKFVETAPSLTGTSALDKKDPAGGAGNGTLTADEKALCQRMGLTEDAYKAAKAL